MAYKLTVDMPNLGPEDKVTIMGLGELQNGKSYKISDEQAEMFRTLHSTVEDKYDDDRPGVLLGREQVPGPTLDELDMHGITVEVLKESSSDQAASSAGEGN
jgi:hypothetical protein